MNDIELKERCPFCGKQLKIVERESWLECGRPARYYYKPACGTADCTVNEFEGYYETPGTSGWLIVGGNFLYTAEIQEWMEVPK